MAWAEGISAEQVQWGRHELAPKILTVCFRIIRRGAKHGDRTGYLRASRTVFG
jgi:hypothetical protein